MARQHRGPHPEDKRLFSKQTWPSLSSAVADLCWLLSRGYPRRSSLELVGNRYMLEKRQRVAVGRSACADEQCLRRRDHQVESADTLELDGFNILTTIEAALSGGVLLACRDGAVRDMASLHGSYRRVEETPQAIELIARATKGASLLWYLDSPVSNSGRLKVRLAEFAQQRGLDWQVELVPDPDPILKQSQAPVVTSDSAILDEVESWLNLGALITSGLETWTVPMAAKVA